MYQQLKQFILITPQPGAQLATAIIDADELSRSEYFEKLSDESRQEIIAFINTSIIGEGYIVKQRDTRLETGDLLIMQINDADSIFGSN